MGCNTSKESVHPVDDSKENNDNQIIKDVNNKEDFNNVDNNEIRNNRISNTELNEGEFLFFC